MEERINPQRSDEATLTPEGDGNVVPGAAESEIAAPTWLLTDDVVDLDSVEMHALHLLRDDLEAQLGRVTMIIEAKRHSQESGLRTLIREIDQGLHREHARTYSVEEVKKIRSNE